MRKLDIINKIKKFNSDLVWELDSPIYYASIGWAGSVKNTYWYDDGLNSLTVKVLSSLLSKLTVNWGDKK